MRGPSADQPSWSPAERCPQGRKTVAWVQGELSPQEAGRSNLVVSILNSFLYMPTFIV